MGLPLRPRLRPLEIAPAGRAEESLFVISDPEGFGDCLLLPRVAAVAAVLMNGRRTLREIQTALEKRSGAAIAMDDLERIVRRLDEAHLLCGPRFERFHRQQVRDYLDNPVRAASQAGAGYPLEPSDLRQMLAGCFTDRGGPGPIVERARGRRRLRGIVSPHIDPHRGGATYAWAYKALVEQSGAQLFVIFGTSHNPMDHLLSVSRKDFRTPLGVVHTDQDFIDRLAESLGSSVAGRQVDLFADELAHRVEHSIEFQTVFLQHVLGGNREFRIVPVLVGSLQSFLADGTQPDETLEVQAFVSAMRGAIQSHPAEACYISAADLAHVGQRFGDPWLLDDRRLQQLADDDGRVLKQVCRGDAAGMMRLVAAEGDANRICGLAPMYMAMAAMGRARGKLLKYDQAVEADRTACVSFASVALYDA